MRPTRSPAHGGEIITLGSLYGFLQGTWPYFTRVSAVCRDSRARGLFTLYQCTCDRARVLTCFLGKLRFSRMGPAFGRAYGGAMDTLRLRAIQQPSRVERLLEAFVTRGPLLPEGAYQIRDPDALPSELQRTLIRATDKGHVWGCWARGLRTWLFTCEMPLDCSRERGTPVLQVNLYDEAGELKEAGTWVTDYAGKWRPCTQ
jgi:hypothetical protein